MEEAVGAGGRSLNVLLGRPCVCLCPGISCAISLQRTVCPGGRGRAGDPCRPQERVKPAEASLRDPDPHRNPNLNVNMDVDHNSNIVSNPDSSLNLCFPSGRRLLRRAAFALHGRPVRWAVHHAARRDMLHGTDPRPQRCLRGGEHLVRHCISLVAHCGGRSMCSSSTTDPARGWPRLLA